MLMGNHGAVIKYSWHIIMGFHGKIETGKSHDLNGTVDGFQEKSPLLLAKSHVHLSYGHHFPDQ